MSSTLKKSVLRQRPRLMYAGVNNNGAGWLNEKKPSDCAEFILIKNGSGKTEIGECSYPFATGDLIILNGGTSHREYFDDTPGRELCFIGVGNLHIYGNAGGEVLKDRDFCIVHTREYFPALQGYFSQLIAETESSQPLHEQISEYLLRILLLFAVRLAAYDDGETFDENLNYIRAKRYFDEHYLEIDSIEGVCKSLYVNKYYLSSLFRKNEGVPPVKYLINKRIQRACEYLETSDDNVADIGKACGFSDPCYFSRTFKRVKGVTPLRYRYLFKLEKSNK